MSLRLFVAIPVPDAIADHLVLLQRAVGGAAWRPRENFHLTLRFFGEIDEMLARDLDDALGQIVAAPFEMRLSGVGSFGGREPSALWAGAEAPPVLDRLASACERAARRAGLAPEKRSFKPHVTLAYLHGTTDQEAASFHARAAALRTDLFWVDHFAMYSSWRTRSASRYIEEAVYPLTGQAGV